MFLQEERYKRDRMLKLDLKKLERMDGDDPDVIRQKAELMDKQDLPPAIDKDVVYSTMKTVLQTMMNKCGEGDYDLKQKLVAAWNALELDDD